MDDANRKRLEGFRQQRVEVLASIADIQKSGWRYFKTLGDGHPHIDVTYERIEELEHTLEHLEGLIEMMDQAIALRRPI